MNIVRCDGCSKDLPGQFDLVITGERSNGMGGGGLPGGEFHWCLDCAQVAFDAVKAARSSRIANSV